MFQSLKGVPGDTFFFVVSGNGETEYCYYFNLIHVQVSTKNVLYHGTLLQSAVVDNMQDYARLLLKFGFVNF